MSPLRRVLAAGVLALGLGAGGAALIAAPASAAACSTSTGVSVVINSSTYCASSGGSAMTVLQKVAATTRVDPPYVGALCSINGYPQPRCPRMPSGSAYWAFFTAQRGGSWTYATVGVDGFTPPAGSVIGFSFGSGGAPSGAVPPKLATPRPTPKPTVKPTPKPKPSTKPPVGATPGTHSTSSSRPGGSSTRPSSGTTSTRSGSASTTTSTRSSSTSEQPTSGTGTGSSSSSSVGGAVAGGPTQPARSTSGGSPWPFAGGAALVAALGAGAAYGARRRRLGQH